ncbi:MAG: hypothetical protein ACPGXZ_07070 [Saprospiraceae bacterium]
MKKGICIVILCLLVASGFGQIDSSAWEGKVVLMVNHHQNFNHKVAKKELKGWNLTDSIYIIADTVLKRNLNSFGGDTVVIVWQTQWQKKFIYKNCQAIGTPDCEMWFLVYRFQFQNFSTKKWETYLFYNDDIKTNNLEVFQQVITKEARQIKYEGKKVIVKDFSWSEKLEAIVKKKFPQFKIVLDYNVPFDKKYKAKEAVFISMSYKSNVFEIVDIRTNRVIEKIILE